MIPYADFYYFGLVLYSTLPTLVLGWFGRASWRWLLLVTLAMLVAQYGATLSLFGQISVTEIWFVLAYALVQYLLARALLWARQRTAARYPYYLVLLLTLLPLVAAKVNPLLAPDFLVGFLGLSYVSFRSLDVIFIIQDKLVSKLPFTEYFAYILFFPAISSGPIDRYRRFTQDWKRTRTRAEFLQDLDGAVHHIFTGFFYKFILAALIKQYWLDPAAARAELLDIISYMYAYSLYLFFDFAGYSAFAVGVSYLFGVHTPENFNRPFLASNIGDFWNRWHISLSSWFRDHVYMRFVLLARKKKWLDKYSASYAGFFLAFGLMGAWHGLVLHLILYGLYHGVLLSGQEAFERWNKEHKLFGTRPLWHGLGVFVTFNLVCFGFLLFSGRIGPSISFASGGPPMYEGEHERADCTMISGWAWDKNQPNTPIQVDIYDGRRRIATLTANGFRQDLLNLRKGNGQHGFVYTTPNRLKDGNPHQIWVRYGGTPTDLQDTLKLIRCTRGE